MLSRQIHASDAPGARASISFLRAVSGRSELRSLEEKLPPAHTALHELSALLEASRYAYPFEHLVQRMPELELCSPMWPWPKQWNPVALQ